MIVKLKKRFSKNKKGSLEVALGRPIVLILVIVTVILVLLFMFRLPLARWIDNFIPNLGGPSEEFQIGQGELSKPDIQISQSDQCVLIGKIGDDRYIYLSKVLDSVDDASTYRTDFFISGGSDSGNINYKIDGSGEAVGGIQNTLFIIDSQFFDVRNKICQTDRIKNLNNGLFKNWAYRELLRINASIFSGASTNGNKRLLCKTGKNIYAENINVVDWPQSDGIQYLNFRGSAQLNNKKVNFANVKEHFVLIYDNSNNFVGIIYKDGSVWLERNLLSSLSQQGKLEFSLREDYALIYSIGFSTWWFNSANFVGLNYGALCNESGVSEPMSYENTAFCETNLRVNDDLFNSLIKNGYKF